LCAPVDIGKLAGIGKWYREKVFSMGRMIGSTEKTLSREALATRVDPLAAAVQVRRGIGVRGLRRGSERHAQ